MEHPHSHDYYLRCEFAIDPSVRSRFDDREAALLEKYGAWLLALSKGWIAPTTEGQSHFVACAHGELDSGNEFERLWWRNQNWLREVDADWQIKRERIALGEARRERMEELDRYCKENEYAYQEAEEFAELWYEAFGNG